MRSNIWKRLHVALLLGAFFANAACPSYAASEGQPGAGGLHYGPSAETNVACRTSMVAGAGDRWIEANGVSVEFGATRRVQLSFSTPLNTNAFHVAMNEAGSNALALIEIQDADGRWEQFWKGQNAPSSAGFGQNCIEHQWEKNRVLRGLRLTFRSSPEEIEVDHAALLRR